MIQPKISTTETAFRFPFVDYAIPGTPATDAKCHFIYFSASAKSGKFNSPRHPSNYPHNIVCVYEFIGLAQEQVRFTFEDFNLEDRHKK